jgi:hypothetical protein
MFQYTFLVFDWRGEGNYTKNFTTARNLVRHGNSDLFCCSDRHFQIQSILMAANHKQCDPTIHQETNTWRSRRGAALLARMSGIRFSMVAFEFITDCDPDVDSASNRKEYLENFLGGK